MTTPAGQHSCPGDPATADASPAQQVPEATAGQGAVRGAGVAFAEVGQQVEFAARARAARCGRFPQGASRPPRVELSAWWTTTAA